MCQRPRTSFGNTSIPLLSPIVSVRTKGSDALAPRQCDNREHPESIRRMTGATKPLPLGL